MPSVAQVLKTPWVPRRPPRGTAGRPRPAGRLARPALRCGAAPAPRGPPQGTSVGRARWSGNTLGHPNAGAGAAAKVPAGEARGAAGAPLPRPGGMLLPRPGSRWRGSPRPRPAQRHGGARLASPVPAPRPSAAGGAAGPGQGHRRPPGGSPRGAAGPPRRLLAGPGTSGRAGRRGALQTGSSLLKWREGRNAALAGETYRRKPTSRTNWSYWMRPWSLLLAP